MGIDNRIFVNGKGAEEYGFPLIKLEEKEHDAKMRASTELDNIIDAGFNFRNKPDGADGHIHKDAVYGFDYFDTIFKIGDKYFQGTINIKNVEKGKLFKDLTKIKDVTEDTLSSYGENPKSQFLRTSSINSIPENSENSNKQFSLKEDSEGNNVVVIEEDIFGGREGEKRKKVVSEYLKEHVGEMLAIIENEKKVYLGKALPEKYNRSQSNKRLDRERRFAKQKAVVGVGEMIEIASGERWEKPIHNNSEVIVNGSYRNSICNDSKKSNSKYSLPDETSVYDYVNEHGTEFADAPPVRDYERTKQRVKNQTYDELAAQVEKLSRDKRLTHGKVLDKNSIKKEMNDLVRTPMTYSESYTTDGKLRKTNLKLVDMATENAAVVYKAIKEGDYAQASTVAYETAREDVENIELVNDAVFSEYKKLHNYLRTHL